MAKRESAPTIVVLGGINMDLIATAPRLPMPGETVRGGEFYTAPGGKGANHAVAAARLGASVRMVGRVGKDTFGPSMLDDLRADGIDVTGVSEDPVNASGVAVILLDDSRQNHIVAVYGANAACGDTELQAATSALDGADVLMLQLEIPFEVSLAAARAAKSMGVTVVLDPAPAAPLPPGSLETVDVLTPNQTEATFLARGPRPRVRTRRGPRARRDGGRVGGRQAGIGGSLLRLPGGERRRLGVSGRGGRCRAGGRSRR